MDCTIYEKVNVDNYNISIEVVLDVVECLQRSLQMKSPSKIILNLRSLLASTLFLYYVASM